MNLAIKVMENIHLIEIMYSIQFDFLLQKMLLFEQNNSILIFLSVL